MEVIVYIVALKITKSESTRENKKKGRKTAYNATSIG